MLLILSAKTLMNTESSRLRGVETYSAGEQEQKARIVRLFVHYKDHVMHSAKSTFITTYIDHLILFATTRRWFLLDPTIRTSLIQIPETCFVLNTHQTLSFMYMQPTQLGISHLKNGSNTDNKYINTHRHAHSTFQCYNPIWDFPDRYLTQTCTCGY